MSRNAVVIDSSDSEDHADSSLQGSVDEQPLVDLEAAESDGGSSATEDGLVRLYDEVFHPYARLPLELKRRIWEFFCPDLASKGRVLCFHYDYDIICQTFMLYDQTEPIRSMAAVHQETRAMVKKAYPHTIDGFGGYRDSILHYNQENDIIQFENTPTRSWQGDIFPACLVGKVTNMAMSYTEGSWVPDGWDPYYHIKDVLPAIPELKRLLLLSEQANIRNRQIRWCASHLVHHYTVTTYEKEPGLGEDFERMYCWPDTANQRPYATSQRPGMLAHIDADLVEAAEARGIEVWPIIQFEGPTELGWFDRLIEKVDAGLALEDISGSESDEGSSDGDETPDEYESEGIDDAEIISDDEPSEDELIPNQPIDISDGSSEDERIRAFNERIPTFDEPVPAENFMEEVLNMMLRGRTEARQRASEARFSSVEAESEDDNDAGTQVTEPRRLAKRRVVLDESSDSEEDVPIAKRPRRAHVTVSSEDEEDGAGEGSSQQTRKGRRAGKLDDDDEEESQEDGPRAVVLSDESDEEDEEEEEEEEQEPKKLSLVERLNLHRRANPVQDLDDDEPGGSGEDYDDEVDDEDDEDAEGGFIDDGVDVGESGDEEDESE